MAEANQARGEFEATIGDVDLILVPSFRRISKAEGVLGRSLVQVTHELASGLGMPVLEMVGVIDALAKDPKPKREDLGAVIVKVGFVGVIPTIQEIIDRVVFGETGEDEEGKAEEGESSNE